MQPRPSAEVSSVPRRRRGIVVVMRTLYRSRIGATRDREEVAALAAWVHERAGDGESVGISLLRTSACQCYRGRDEAGAGPRPRGLALASICRCCLSPDRGMLMQRHAATSFCSLAGALTLLAVFAVGCNGGSSTAPPINSGSTATPSPSPVPLPASASATLSVGTSAASASLGPVLGGYSAASPCPPRRTPRPDGNAQCHAARGTPVVQTVKRRAQRSRRRIAPIAFMTITST